MELKELPAHSQYYKYFNDKMKKPTPIVTMLVPGDKRPQAKCAYLHTQPLEKHLLFHASIGNKPIKFG